MSERIGIGGGSATGISADLSRNSEPEFAAQIVRRGAQSLGLPQFRR
jgi:hypothetical protein